MKTLIRKRTLRAALSALCVFALCVCACSAALSPKAWADYEPPQALKALWELNHDVIGGLCIPGTSVNYPILQSAVRDDYYLNVCLDGTEGKPGCIYINACEGQTFDTFNTVIYGRNMSDGSYFGALRDYLNPEFMEGHREIDIYGVDAEHVYDVFAVVIYNDKRITDYYPDEVLEDRLAFLSSLLEEGLEGSIIFHDVPVDPARGRIITLSTGIDNMPNNRLLVLATER